MDAFTAVTQKGRMRARGPRLHSLRYVREVKTESWGNGGKNGGAKRRAKSERGVGHRGMSNRSSRSRTTAFREDFYEIIGRSRIPGGSCCGDPLPKSSVADKHPPPSILLRELFSERAVPAHISRERNWSMSFSRIPHAHSTAAESNESGNESHVQRCMQPVPA